jgi:FtsP/CotA-like multicopper oxidase with cupredoxin domain
LTNRDGRVVPNQFYDYHWPIVLAGFTTEMIMIANDGNLLPAPIVLTELDQMGIAERYDIVIDFSPE